MKRALDVNDSSDSDSDSDETKPKMFLRLGNCEVCAKHEAKYTCPKCEVKTCCLQCVNIHKKELKCDGIRDRTKFIPLRNMTNRDFMSDYYFLEEATRFVENRKADKIKRYTRYNKQLPNYLFRLREAAFARKITIRFLLDNFTRRKTNTTNYDWTNHIIYWRVEWVFTNADDAKFIDDRCSENLKISELLDKYVNPESTVEVPQKKSLEFYQSKGMGNLKILLKAEGVKRCRNRFYALDCTKSLKENLAGKTVVEYPTIYVTYDEQSVGYDVIDSDEDIESEVREHNKKLDEIRKANSSQSGNVVEAEKDDLDELQRVLDEKKREERRMKREQFEKEPNNYLFADESLWDVLSSSESDGAQTEEES